MNLNVVVLAAGKGTRMYSTVPKVLHRLAGKPILNHVLDTARALDCNNLQVVIGYGADIIKSALAGNEGDGDVNFVLQEEQHGTAHAVDQALPFLDIGAIALVLYGDVPLISPATLQALLDKVHDNSMGVLTCVVDNPTGLGRIIRDNDGQITRIVEERDASETEKGIHEINTGFMAIPVSKLVTWLPRVRAENAQGEYYLTDLVEIALADGADVVTSLCGDQAEITGINNRKQLAELERIHQKKMNEELMKNGVTLLDPLRVDIRGDVSIARDVEIDVNVILEGVVNIAGGARIGAGCILKNCTIGENTELYPYTLIEDAVIGKNCHLGPFARVRPGTELKDNAKLGNFVETKKAVIGKGSKVNHLSYVGDAELGEEVNVGAGTITCNYDGANKYKTIVGNGVFIGSNAVLVAPVELEDGAFIAAGSTITKPVGKDQLAVGRGRQSNIDGWQKPVKNEK